ncbi:MAG TPA: ribosome biogenesis GTPase Der [Pseudomonadales bacterium]
MLPVVALVGRPNVGKSTLFNRITGSRDAIVANFSGLTRDRKYGEACFEQHRFMLIDTGGLTGDELGIDQAMAGQSWQAVDEADLVLLVVDARAGLLPDDQHIIDTLRSRGKPFHLVVNKVDGVDHDQAMAEFFATGCEHLFPVTATHGRGVRSLLEFVVSQLPSDDSDEPSAVDAGIKIAVVGRPNVGKSTLVNRMLGEERVIVYDMPGTTRDSIYIHYQRHDKPYTLIDTAGVRRRKNVRETVEKFSIVKTLQAIDDANVVIVVIDAREDLVDQDLNLLGLCIDAGRALVIAVNKWDGLDSDQRAHIKRELERRLVFVDYAEVHFISALHGSGVGNLYQSVEKAYRAATQKLSTRRLTDILEAAVAEHQPPLVAGRRIKLRYAHAGGSNPPIIVVHGNQTDKLPNHYKRYLEKVYRKQLGLFGTPVRMEFRTGDNPFADKPGPKAIDRRQKQRQRLQKKRQD